VWFDAVVGNVDRSHRNPNMLFWRGIWLIDHGATLSFHHRWDSAEAFDTRPYDGHDHALAGSGPDLAGADAALADLMTAELVRAALDEVPDEWLTDDGVFATAGDARSAYAARIEGRRAARGTWLPDLVDSLAAR